MKKISAFFCAMIVALYIGNISFAEATYSKERRDVLSFVELYTQHWMEHQDEIGPFHPLDYYYNNINPYLVDGYVMLNCHAGELLLRPEDFTIEEYSNIVYLYGANEESNNDRFFRSCLSFAVLEHGSNATAVWAKTPVDEASKILSNAFQTINWDVLFEEKEVQIYKGNYTYYFSFFRTEEGQIMIYLAAR